MIKHRSIVILKELLVMDNKKHVVIKIKVGDKVDINRKEFYGKRDKM